MKPPSPQQGEPMTTPPELSEDRLTLIWVDLIGQHQHAETPYTKNRAAERLATLDALLAFYRANTKVVEAAEHVEDCCARIRLSRSAKDHDDACTDRHTALMRMGQALKARKDGSK